MMFSLLNVVFSCNRTTFYVPLKGSAGYTSMRQYETQRSIFSHYIDPVYFILKRCVSTP